MAECIHGFDDGLCAICFPPKQPEAPAPASRPAARVGARSSTLRPTPSRPASRSGAPRATSGRLSDPASDVDARQVRAYHVTHLDNLAGILGAGAVLPAAGDRAAAPAVDVAAPAAREYRRSTELTGTDAVIAEYVPFLLSTDADVWDAIRTGTADPRLTSEAVERPAAEYVLLVASVGSALGARADAPGAVALAGSDIALAGDAVAVGWDAAERMLRRLARLDDGAGMVRAELLVRGEVPLERFSLIAVSNDRVRDRVRQALSAVGAKARVAVYPPWFQPGGGAEG